MSENENRIVCANTWQQGAEIEQERDRKLRGTLTVGELRAILNSIPAKRDDVPVVVVEGPEFPEFSPLTGWRGEKWHGTTVADGNVLVLYLEA